MVQRELAGVTHLVSTRRGHACARARRSPRSSPRPSRAARSRARRRSPPLDLIAALEPVGRGASMGALGVVRPNGDFELALTIRTFAIADGTDPPLGRRRDRLGLRARGRDRGVVGQGAAAPGGRSARRCPYDELLAAAVAGRGLVDPAAAGLPRRRRGAPARRRRLRDRADPERPPGAAAPARRAAAGARASRFGCRRPTASSELALQAVEAAGDARRGRCGSSAPA